MSTLRSAPAHPPRLPKSNRALRRQFKGRTAAVVFVVAFRSDRIRHRRRIVVRTEAGRLRNIELVLRRRWWRSAALRRRIRPWFRNRRARLRLAEFARLRSEEHTSELQS